MKIDPILIGIICVCLIIFLLNFFKIREGGHHAFLPFAPLEIKCPSGYDQTPQEEDGKKICVSPKSSGAGGCSWAGGDSGQATCFSGYDKGGSPVFQINAPPDGSEKGFHGIRPDPRFDAGEICGYGVDSPSATPKPCTNTTESQGSDAYKKQASSRDNRATYHRRIPPLESPIQLQAPLDDAECAVLNRCCHHIRQRGVQSAYHGCMPRC